MTPDSDPIQDRRELAKEYARLFQQYSELRTNVLNALQNEHVTQAEFDGMIERIAAHLRTMKSIRLRLRAGRRS